MARRNKHKYILNSPISLLSTILIMVFIVPVVVLPFVNALGGFEEIITDLIELLPFGHAFHHIAILIVNSITGQIVNYHSIQGVFTLSYVIQELAEGIFTVIIYEALCLATSMLMGLADKNNRGRWNGMKRMVVKVAMAVIAACLAPALINWTFANMGGLSNGWRTFLSGVISAVLLGGGGWFFVTLFSAKAVGTVIAFVLLKFLVVGFVRLVFSYIFLFVLLIGFQQGTFSLMLSGMSGFLGVILILAGLELMLDKIVD